MAKLVLGCGESSVEAVRNADNDPDNWILARMLWPNTTRWMIEGSKAPGDRWCVLVDDVDNVDLDRDHATDCYRTVHDFAAAVKACEGVDPRDVTARDETFTAMLDAGFIGRGALTGG